jgi:GH24 family phage-related lysozyme (muramidase)
MSLFTRLRTFARSLAVEPRRVSEKPKAVTCPAPQVSEKPEPLPNGIKAANEALNAQPLSKAQELPPVTHPSPPTGLTVRAHMELIEHEAIVFEAYKCSAGVWTWGVGVTDASGHKVGRYKGNPQTLTRVLEVYEWLVRTKYLPEVRAAFGRIELNEHQLAAALSFHWNTGAIHRASWVRSFRNGDVERAKDEIMDWVIPREIEARRKAERNLFFDGTWTTDGKVRVIHRVNGNGTPVWKSGRTTDISAELTDVLARAGK